MNEVLDPHALMAGPGQQRLGAVDGNEPASEGLDEVLRIGCRAQRLGGDRLDDRQHVLRTVVKLAIGKPQRRKSQQGIHAE